MKIFLLFLILKAIIYQVNTLCATDCTECSDRSECEVIGLGTPGACSYTDGNGEDGSGGICEYTKTCDNDCSKCSKNDCLNS